MKKYLIGLLVLLSISLNATDLYVATNGSANGDGTLQNPFKDLQQAIDLANEGDKIWMRGGTYPSPEFRVNKSNLTISSYPNEWAILEAPTGIEDIASCLWYNDPYVKGGKLERLEIIGGYYYGISFETDWDWGIPIASRRGVSDIEIVSCIIHHTGRDAIKIKPRCNNIKVISCHIHHTGVGISNSVGNGGPNAEGIDNVNGDNMEVKYCYIHDISTTGVYVKGGASNALIIGNYITNTGEAGILLGFYTDAEFFDTEALYYECINSKAVNNIVTHTGGAGIGFFASKNCQAIHNTSSTGSEQFHSPLFFSKGEVWINENSTIARPNENITVVNNIFILTNYEDEHHVLQVREGAIEGGNNNINNNCYYQAKGNMTFDDGVSWPYLDFNGWKQKGYDANSLNKDPMLNSAWHLQANSPMINSAISSQEQKDFDGNDRSGGSDIGADEFNNSFSLLIPPPSNIIGTGYIFSGTSAIYEQRIPESQVYPNPTKGILFLSNTPQGTPYKIISANGYQLSKGIYSHGINTDHLSAGIYWVIVPGNVYKFIKMN